MKEEKLTDEELVKSMKALIATQYWKDFVNHITENIIPAHKEACINSVFTGNDREATNQACLIEGLIEAIQEPQTVVDTLESKPNIVKKFCNSCKRVFDDLIHSDQK